MTRPSDGGEVPASEFTAQPGDVTDRTDLRDIVDLVIRARACAEDLGLDHPRVGDLTGVLAFDLDIALDHVVTLTDDLDRDPAGQGSRRQTATGNGADRGLSAARGAPAGLATAPRPVR